MISFSGGGFIETGKRMCGDCGWIEETGFGGNNKIDKSCDEV